MKLRITDSTDKKNLGQEITDTFPVQLSGYEFMPDGLPIKLGANEWRFFNSNYSIDTREV